MRFLKNVIFVLIIMFFTSCDDKHFLKNNQYRDEVHQQFLNRKEEAKHRNDALFGVFDNKKLTIKQREALEFLFAYMPLSDLADYDGDFFLQQVNVAFEARDYFPWGTAVPDDIFRHFVLVYRVNNENLDSGRTVFFNELKDRVKHLSMYEAALEVNHWCHEKVLYRGSDARTSSPLATVKTSWGRCGEESVLTVTALRAVGIPARQCYTPRWVHTDDNHAWVEVWVDGKWHYLGACEPEPELDMAWFTAAAKRAMMVHTTVFGKYNGTEEKNMETPLYSVINLLGNYTQTRKVNVEIVDMEGNPVPAANVKFKVYNYAEIYPVATKIADSSGKASILSGMGDIMVWAEKDGRYGYAKSTPDLALLTLKLDKKKPQLYEETFTMNVPPEKITETVSSDKIAENKRRLAQEDSIRNAYMQTFATAEDAEKLTNTTNLDGKIIHGYLEAAQGNWNEIAKFIQDEARNPCLFDFLATLSQKDLRDVPADYLIDHLENTEKTIDTKVISTEIFIENILSPRIGLEQIRPWRSFFQQKTIIDKISKHRKASEIIDYINENITINDDENYYHCPITPQGVYELKVADKKSRNVFFVAVCRSFGIPAKLDEATAKPLYLESGKWITVNFEKTTNTISKKGILTINKDISALVKPNYYINYTLSVFENGDFQTLDLYDDERLKTLPATLNLDAGYYRLMTGSRANDGSVAVYANYFNIEENKPTQILVKMPELKDKLLVKGSVDMNTEIQLFDNQNVSLKDLANQKGLMLCFIHPTQEPSKHVLQDLPLQKDELEQWNGGVLFVVMDKQCNFDAKSFKNLPKQTVFGVDGQVLLNNVVNALQIDFKDNYPLTVYLSTTGGILYYSTGYKIGIGENILKTIRQEHK